MRWGRGGMGWRGWNNRRMVTSKWQETVVHHQTAENQDVQVRVAEHQISTEEEYKDELHKHNARVTAWENDAITNFITSRIHLAIVDLKQDTPADGLQKLKRPPVLAEGKRKLFVMQLDLAYAPDHASCKKRKISIFRPMNPTMSDDCLESAKNVYMTCRTSEENGTCSDVFMVTLPPAPVNQSWENKNLATVVKSMKQFSPRHQTPSVGTIRRPGRLQLYQRQSKAFGSNPHDSIAYTSEAKVTIHSGPMNFLTGGHTNVHEWPVQEISAVSMPTVPETKFATLFGADVETVAMDANMDDEGPATNEPVGSADGQEDGRAHQKGAPL